MPQRPLRDLALNQGAFLLSFVGKAIVFVVISRHLGKESLGHYAYAMTFAVTFFLVSNLGLSSTQVREISKHPHRLFDFLSSLAVLQFLIVLALLPPFLIYAVFLVPDPTLSIFLGLALVLAALEKLRHFLGSNLNGLGLISTLSLTSVLEIGLELGLILGAFFLTRDLVAVFLAYIVKGCLAIAYVSWLNATAADQLLSKAGALPRSLLWPSLHLDLRRLLCELGTRLLARQEAPPISGMWLDFLRQVGPVFQWELLQALLLFSPMLLLEHLSGPIAVADYAVCTKTASFFNFLLFGIGVVYLPKFSQAPEAGAIAGHVRDLVRYVGLLALPLGVGAWFVAEEVLIAIWGLRFAGLAPWFLLSLTTLLLTFLSQGLKTLAIARERLTPLIRLAAGILLCKVALLLWLVPRSTASGAVLSDLGAEIFLTLGLFTAFVLEYRDFRPDLLALTRYLFGCAVMAAGLTLFPTASLPLDIALGATLYGLILLPWEGRTLLSQLRRNPAR